jgi:hypothetical protein
LVPDQISLRQCKCCDGCLPRRCLAQVASRSRKCNISLPQPSALVRCPCIGVATGWGFRRHSGEGRRHRTSFCQENRISLRGRRTGGALERFHGRDRQPNKPIRPTLKRSAGFSR